MRTKVLYVASNPVKTDRLETERERRDVLDLLRGAPGEDALEFIPIPAARFRDVRRALHEHLPAIVYFTGHGTIKNTIVLEEDGGGRKDVGPFALAGLVGEFAEHVKVVVLNACSSEPLAEEVAKRIDCVIGMAEPIQDSAGRAFADAFFEALAFGKSVQKAFDLGKNAAFACGTPEIVPRLFEREAGMAAKTVPVEHAKNTPAGAPAPSPSRIHHLRPVHIAAFLAAATVTAILGWSARQNRRQPSTPNPGTAAASAPPMPSATGPTSAQVSVPAPSAFTMDRGDTGTPASSRIHPAPPASAGDILPDALPAPNAVTGSATCKNDICSVSLDAGMFDRSFRSVCIDMAVEGVPLRCLLRTDARGRSMATCDRTDANSKKPFDGGPFRWRRCQG